MSKVTQKQAGPLFRNYLKLFEAVINLIEIRKLSFCSFHGKNHNKKIKNENKKIKAKLTNKQDGVAEFKAEP